MPDLALHHVAVVTSDLDASVRFYGEVIGLDRLDRPDFPMPGAWFGCVDRQVHLVVHPGTFRARGVDPADVHFALRTDDFEAMIDRLRSVGFRDDAAPDDPRRMLIVRGGPAGFSQVFFCDPDRNTIEINSAALSDPS